MPEVSVIIVNWNARQYLARCLAALVEHGAGVDYDLWVVDNASEDDSVAFVQQAYPQAHLIMNAQNVGFARANNQAIAQSTGRFLLLLNSDAFLQAGALESLLQAMRNHPDTGIAGAQLFYEDGRLQRSCYAFPTLASELWQTLWLDRLFPHSRVFGGYQMTWWAMDTPREVDWVMGACILVRREALEQVGGFDESFFMYSEETDLCYRMKQAGWKVRYVPDARVVHVWGGSANLAGRETLVRLYQSRVQFFRKHYGPLTAFGYKLLLGFSSLVRTAMGWVISTVFRRPGVQNQSRAYWHLFRRVHLF
ncbi:MAG TPA: glycosyltransferase family 2 protein [Anaerolinea thermolimosa]|uniref:Glycosyltransferase family 2 protein n=1 Tax=Anaerolinea thermolimosa TaxID=229919 RepID=A0A3D1JG54_9CHLR|nr:glycosyltransferase family 2 protein [Anaerolinea thermolimosa]